MTAIWQLRARAALSASSKARRFMTGSVPGMPMHTGHVAELGGKPNLRAAAAKELGLRQKLHVDFQADDGAVGHSRHSDDRGRTTGLAGNSTKSASPGYAAHGRNLQRPGHLRPF